MLGLALIESIRVSRSHPFVSGTDPVRINRRRENLCVSRAWYGSLWYANRCRLRRTLSTPCRRLITQFSSSELPAWAHELQRMGV